MELDNIKQRTTWNDASASINSNFMKVRQAILALQSEGGGLDEAELEEFLTSNGYTKEEWVLAQNALLEERIENLEQEGGAVNVEGSEFVNVDEDGTISLDVDPQGGLGRTEQGLGIVDIPSHLLEGIEIEVDSSMSDTSENAVANKVIKKYVDQRAEQAYEQANEYTDEEIAGLREELQNGIDHPVFEFEFDSATNKATAEMVAGLAEAIAENKLILCAGRTYKFILEQEGMYGLVSDAYMDIMDGKLKASVLAVMSSSYDVQLAEEEVPVGTEITEATISGWGFTKNDGTITGIMMNGATKGTSGVVDLGNVLTEHQKLKTINNQSIVGEGNITIQGGSATPRVEMTAASAAIEPNKFYVWPMMDSLDLTLGTEQTGVMNRYLFQFRNPKAGLTMLTLPDDITWSEDTELDENGLPVMEAAAFYRIEIIEGLASLKKWKLVYINFADAEVERVLMANGVGDGIGITKKDAAAVTNMDYVFDMNESITEFDEFRYFTGVTRLLSDNISANHSGGFMGCVNLRRITLPSSLTKFGKGSDTSYDGAGAFYGCTSLEYVGNTSHLDYVGDASFYNCKSLIAIDLSSATYIGYYAFENCTSLEQVSLSDSLQEIGGYAFSGCENLELDITGKLALITTLPLGVFNGTKTTGELSMPNLENIPYGYVKKQAFASANLIKILNLGKISEIPDGYNNNFPGVFAKNVNLIFVILPETLTYIGNRTFYQDTSLQTIICNAVIPPQLHNTAFNSTNSTFIIYVPDESVEAYKTATNWNAYADRIKGISEYTG